MPPLTSSVALLRPAGHAAHEALPPLTLRHPVGQLKQNVSPSREICPGGQMSQSDSASCLEAISPLSALN